MPKVRVLIVDDSAFIRRVLSDQITADGDLEVVGQAPNGRLALQRVEQLRPDVVVLDVEMPELDGLATLAELRKRDARLPVIMFSALTEPAAAATVDALLLGATDYVTKPTAADGADRIRDELIPKIKAACGAARTGSGAAPPRHQPTLQAGMAACLALASPHQGTARGAAFGRSIRLDPAPARPEILVIGVSTGGPNALAALFAGLPASFPIPIALVQHMPPMFTRILAERLSQSSKIAVHECTEGMVPRAGQAYVAPGDHHMRLGRQGPAVTLHLNRDSPENACRPAVDVLFRSAAEVYRSRVLALVLTGMGRDGLRGAQTIREAGGQIWAQDEATSVVWGMPGAVVREGLTERVLPLGQIGPEIVRRVSRHPSDSRPVRP
jgi:two-component system chemotaxis response regulator CheB